MARTSARPAARRRSATSPALPRRGIATSTCSPASTRSARLATAPPEAVDGTVDLLLRLVVASAAGATLGFEREVRNHAAGIRTHALVALGSALFTVAGAYGFHDVLRAPSVDPARVAAQVASGI